MWFCSSLSLPILLKLEWEGWVVFCFSARDYSGWQRGWNGHMSNSKCGIFLESCSLYSGEVWSYRRLGKCGIWFKAKEISGGSLGKSDSLSAALRWFFREVIHWGVQSVKSFKQPAAGGEWRDTVIPLSCLSSIFYLLYITQNPWPEAWLLSTEWRNNFICHDQVYWRIIGTIPALDKVLCQPVLNPVKLITRAECFPPLIPPSLTLSCYRDKSSKVVNILISLGLDLKFSRGPFQPLASCDSIHDIDISRNLQVFTGSKSQGARGAMYK